MILKTPQNRPATLFPKTCQFPVTHYHFFMNESSFRCGPKKKQCQEEEQEHCTT